MWLSLALALLKLAGSIAGWLRDRQMLDAGQRREVAAALARVARQAGAARAIEDEVARWSEAEIDAALEGEEWDHQP
jgi:hypothetical protein